MRFREFITEGDIHSALPTLQSLLNFLRNRAQNKKINATISKRSIVNMMKNTGVEIFSSELLDDLLDNPMIAPQIQTVENDMVILSPIGGEVEPEPDFELDMDDELFGDDEDMFGDDDIFGEPDSVGEFQPEPDMPLSPEENPENQQQDKTVHNMAHRALQKRT